MNKEIASKLWKIFQEASDYLIGLYYIFLKLVLFKGLSNI